MLHNREIWGHSLSQGTTGGITKEKLQSILSCNDVKNDTLFLKLSSPTSYCQTNNEENTKHISLEGHFMKQMTNSTSHNCEVCQITRKC